MYSDNGPSLIEAAPWIERFKGSTVVIKLGGDLLASTAVLDRLARQIVTVQKCGINAVVVHGAGRQIDEACTAAGIEINKVDGRRITDPQTVQVVVTVLQSLSQKVASAITANGGKALVPSPEAWPVTAHRRPPVTTSTGQVQDYGLVGDVTSVELPLGDGIPVVASLGMSGSGFLNINADTTARSVATALKALKVVYVTSVPGLYHSLEDPGPISDMSLSQAVAMLASPEVTGGMKAKLQECVRALESGVGSVHIIGGREPHTILRELFTGEGCGTLVHPDQ